MAKRVADLWYAVDTRDSRIIRFAEAHVDSYAVGDVWLVRGSQMDVAVDGGSGIIAAGPLVEAIADKPVLCVALTCSYDHAGGWHSFSRRACHRLDVADLADPQLENAELHRYLTEDRFSAHPWPGYSAADNQMVGAEPTQLLEDGEIIDLGDRTLEMLHTPGRSPGGLSLWESRTGTLFSGEILYDGDHGPAWPPADPVSYCASLRRLRDLPAVVVHPGHYGSFGGERMASLIDAQLADLDD
jgi:glyoxylase-like metal-dependent hydrolase (beta-lactamase superfamily II)